MRIRKYRVLVPAPHIDAMWQFGRANQAQFYCIKVEKDCSVFETFMPIETYLMFKVAIPFRELTDNEYT